MIDITTSRSFAQELANLNEKQRQELFQSLTDEQAMQLLYDWEMWARDKQLPPPGDWTVWLIMAGRGFGKALALDTPIPTLAGWTTMGDIQVGDTLFDENGNPTTVTFVTPVMHDHTCYDVVFSDGSVVTADADHQWFTWTHAARKSAARRVEHSTRTWVKPRSHCFPSVVTTEQIKATLVQGTRGDVNHSIDVCKSLQCPITNLPINPYVLGVWLGDGSSNGAELTCVDDEILQHIEDAGYRVRPYKVNGDKTPRYGIGSVKPSRDPITGRMNSNGSLHSTLKAMGLLNNKHVPSAYLRSSIEQRLALLQGLMDTDGSVQIGGHCEFLCTNKFLSDAVFELAASLGIKPTMAEERATLYGKDCGPRYRVSFTPYIPVFRLLRKRERQHQGGAQRERQLRRYIIDVRERSSVPVRCIQVDSPNHLFLVGRAMIPTHNTRTGAEWIRAEVEPGRRGRIALVGRTAADVRDVMVEGESGILAISPSWFRPKYEPSKRRLTWPNGAIATTYSADEPDLLRGPQHDGFWADEVAAWAYEDSYDQLMFGLRLGKKPRGIATTTPRPTRLIRRLVKDKNVHVTHGTTFENKANLAPTFFEQVVGRYQNSRLGLQELFAQLLEDAQGALWKRDAMIEQYRVTEYPNLVRIVVAVDPAVADSSAKTEEEADENAETGIVVAGIAANGHGYVLDDMSIQASPLTWASEAVTAYKKYKADRIVGEKNNGGALVESNIRTVDSRVSYNAVWASRGKYTRAEPVASFYEQGKVHHVGLFPQLEDQQCQWEPLTGQKSPDRLDALVWALTELMLPDGPTADVHLEAMRRRLARVQGEKQA